MKRCKALAHGAEYVGLVFFQKSPRFISLPRAKELVKFCSEKQKKVGLFVNADIKIMNIFQIMLV